VTTSENASVPATSHWSLANVREDGREEQPLDHRGAGGDDARSVEGEGRHGVES
jgi:hypothetical protein